MYIEKRSIAKAGRREPFQCEKVSARLTRLADGLNITEANCQHLATNVMESAQTGMSSTAVDTLIAETCAYNSQNHPDFSLLGARVLVSQLHKTTDASWLHTTQRLFATGSTVNGGGVPMAQVYVDVATAETTVTKIEAALDYHRDYSYDYFGFKTLARSYLLRIDNEIAERPQQMLMRCALAVHLDDVDAAIETYHLMSNSFFTHATPTLFNAGLQKGQLSSCYLLSIAKDSISGIFETVKQCAKISKGAGGIGLAISNVRATGSRVRGTNGGSNGIVPMLKVFNETARYVDQGGGKRKGAFAIYLEPWHADISAFLDLKKNHGKEENRARDLFYGLWVPDLFMERVEDDAQWTLFCPNTALDLTTGKSLQDVYGAEFKTLYETLEREGLGVRTLPARELWNKVLEAQLETGVPYICYKDHVNHRSNQKNLGTIRSSNLCTEIMQYTSSKEVAVCNLASVALNKFTLEGATGAPDAKNRYNFKELHRVVKIMTRNLNKVIDRNVYPVPEAEYSNKMHRPIGIGVQGLADAFIKLRLPFECTDAKELNRIIFETIYHAACEASCELAKEHGATYPSFPTSPAAQGKLQFDLWNEHPSKLGERCVHSGLWNWTALKCDIAKYGLYNSLLVAPMPTASTAQILGNTESTEPYTQNMYVRRVLSGDFVQMNRHLVKDLERIQLWDDDMKQALLASNGSVQEIARIPDTLKELYKTGWEIKQKCILEYAADRSPYIDQSQSLNIHMADASAKKLSSMHFCGWRLGLKTGMYYLRTKAAVDPMKITLNKPVSFESAAPTFPTPSYERQDWRANPCTTLTAPLSNTCESCGS